MLAYLSCYTHCVAIDLLLFVFYYNGVTFKYKDYRADGARCKVMNLELVSSFCCSASTSCRRASTASATTACSPASCADNIARARELLRCQAPNASRPMSKSTGPNGPPTPVHAAAAA